MALRNRVVLSGSLGNEERWSTGMTFRSLGSNSGISGGESLLSWATEIAAALPDIVDTRLQVFLSQVGTIDSVDTYFYPSTGNATGVGNAPADFTGINPLQHPLQTCCVFSTRGALSGARYRGRNYWPAIGATIGQDGKFSAPGDGSQRAIQWANLLREICELAPGVDDMAPFIYSPTYDTMTPVVSVLSGNVPDVQRRHADRLSELYSQVAYPPLN